MSPEARCEEERCEPVFRMVERVPSKDRFSRNPVQRIACLWGAWELKMPPLRSDTNFDSVYADLTTVLLARKIGALLRERPISRVHEIGVGTYGVLSLYIKKKFPHVVLSASTVDPREVESARQVASANACSYDCMESDVLDRVSGTFDLIWWNLPYYQPDVEACIDRLCRQVREKDALVPGGLLLLGFNGVPLKTERVTAVIARYPRLILDECQTFSWNPHVLMLAKYQPEGGFSKSPG